MSRANHIPVAFDPSWAAKREQDPWPVVSNWDIRQVILLGRARGEDLSNMAVRLVIGARDNGMSVVRYVAEIYRRIDAHNAAHEALTTNA